MKFKNWWIFFPSIIFAYYIARTITFSVLLNYLQIMKSEWFKFLALHLPIISNLINWIEQKKTGKEENNFNSIKILIALTQQQLYVKKDSFALAKSQYNLIYKFEFKIKVNYFFHISFRRPYGSMSKQLKESDERRKLKMKLINALHFMLYHLIDHFWIAN